jgi:organic radical activating enzyme
MDFLREHEPERYAEIVSSASKRMRGSANPVHNVPIEELSARAKKTFTGRKVSAAEREASRQRMLGENNPMKDKEVVQRAFLSSEQGKSSYELKFESIMSDANLMDTLDFVGDGALPVGYKYPDYVVRGQKKLIEVYSKTFAYGKADKKLRGKAWRDARRAHFEKHGYKVLFVSLDSRCSKEKIVERVRKFVHNGKSVSAIKRVRLSDYPYPSTRPKPLPVYNISCAPHNTYLIDNMWVHNCDTKYTWDDELLALSPPDKLPISEIVRRVGVFFMQNPQTANIVITGGEPTMHKSKFEDLVTKLMLRVPSYVSIEIETNGLYGSTPDFISNLPYPVTRLRFNVSPKLPNTGNKVPIDSYVDLVYSNHYSLAAHPFTVKRLLKFVVDGDKAMDEIDDFVDGIAARTMMDFHRSSVYLMPEGNTVEAQLKNMPYVIDAALARGYSFTPRLHVLRWNGLPGV